MAAIPSAFELELPHGRCTGIAIGTALALAEAESELHADERAVAATLSERRRRTWVIGRLALRRSLRAVLAREDAPDGALGGLGVELDALAIGVTARGAPALPPGVTGSISHKDDFVVALAARDALGPVGVDVEWDRPPKHDVRRHVLRADEGVDLEGPWPATASETMLRFSAKEAIYKALDRHVGRYVGFHEVSVLPQADATARVHLHLKGGEGPFVVTVHWERRAGLLLTSARVACATPGAPPERDAR